MLTALCNYAAYCMSKVPLLQPDDVTLRTDKRHCAGDFYKTGQKQAGVKKVTTDIYDGMTHPKMLNDTHCVGYSSYISVHCMQLCHVSPVAILAYMPCNGCLKYVQPWGHINGMLHVG